ncbi:MAG TPA: sialidase family protein [Polyangiaceae bacterium]
MSLPIPRVKPLGWVDDEVFLAAQATQLDLNISLLDGQNSVDEQLAAHAGMQFTRTDLKSGTSILSKLTAIQQTTTVGAPANRQAMILASGTTTLPAPAFEMLNDGTSPSLCQNFGAGTGGVPLSAPACDASGVFFYGGNGGNVYASFDGGASSVLQTVTGLSAPVTWVGATLAHYLVWELSTSRLYVSSALAGTWTNSVFAFSSPIDLATNGAGVYVMYGNASGTPKIYRSTDDGVTWTLEFNAPTSGVGGLCYSTTDQKFYLLVPDSLTSQPKLYQSADGATWTLARTIAALQGANFGGHHTVAAVGNVIACVANRAVNAINRHPYGVAYTLDAGATWFEEYFSDPTGGNPIAELIAANGRFYAIDSLALYQSGVLAAPPVLFTGV